MQLPKQKDALGFPKFAALPYSALCSAAVLLFPNLQLPEPEDVCNAFAPACKDSMHDNVGTMLLPAHVYNVISKTQERRAKQSNVPLFLDLVQHKVVRCLLFQGSAPALQNFPFQDSKVSTLKPLEKLPLYTLLLGAKMPYPEHL
jgi:hypothetical protein